MSSHASDLSKIEENSAKLKDNSAIEALMEERWLEARKKVEEKILRKKKEAKERAAAEAKQIADEEAALKEVKQLTSETEVEKAATISWLKMFLGTAAGAGMLYALWWKYCRSKIGSDATGARASVVTSIKANDGSGNKVDSSTRPSGGNVFNSKQTNYGRPSTIDTSITVGAVAGAAIMKQTTIKQQTQKGQRQRKWKQNLASVDANSSHGSVNATAFDPEDANKKMWDERRKKRQEKKQEAISKAEQQVKAGEARKKEETKAEAKRVADETSKQQKRLEAIKKIEKRKQSEHNESQEKIEEDGGGNDGKMDVDVLPWDQRLNAAMDSVQVSGEVEETWV